MDKLIRLILVIGGCYLLLDGLLHLTDIRFADVKTIWPQEALTFAQFLSKIYGSFVILAAILCFVIQNDVIKYKGIIIAAALWGAFHAMVLSYISLNTDFTAIFKNYPSIYVWMPFYNQYLYFEIVLLLIFCSSVLIWSKSKSLKKS